MLSAGLFREGSESNVPGTHWAQSSQFRLLSLTSVCNQFWLIRKFFFKSESLVPVYNHVVIQSNPELKISHESRKKYSVIFLNLDSTRVRDHLRVFVRWHGIYSLLQVGVPEETMLVPFHPRNAFRNSVPARSFFGPFPLVLLPRELDGTDFTKVSDFSFKVALSKINWKACFQPFVHHNSSAWGLLSVRTAAITLCWL